MSLTHATARMQSTPTAAPSPNVAWLADHWRAERRLGAVLLLFKVFTCVFLATIWTLIALDGSSPF